MKIEINLTNEDLLDNTKVDFYDGKTIFFDIVDSLPSKLCFKAWGVYIDEKINWRSPHVNLLGKETSFNIDELDKYNGTVVKGFSELIFEETIAANINIYPYDNRKFIKRENGKELLFKKKWNINEIDNDCKEYKLDTSIYFPYGACELSIYTKGNVYLIFNTDDCVPLREYIEMKDSKDSFLGFLNTDNYRNGSSNIMDFVSIDS